LWSVALPTSVLSSREAILPVVPTHQFSFRLEKDSQGLRSLPLLAPAGKRSCSFLLLTNSLSVQQKGFGRLHYPAVLCQAGKISCSVSLSTNSLSAWAPMLECCALDTFSLQSGIDPAGSYYLQILFLSGQGLCSPGIPPSSLSGRADSLQCGTQHQFSFRLETY